MTTYGIAVSGLGALGQSSKLDLIANNLANLSTPGYRADRISFRERLAEALEDRPQLQYYNALVHRHGGAPFVDAVRFDPAPGAFEQTGRSLDFAVRSRGFFGVRERETGEVFHTRAGNFLLDGEGRLVTADGRHEVLDREGRTVRVETGRGGELRLSADGTLSQGPDEVATLAVTDFDDYALLRKRGANLFSNEGAAEIAPERLQVAQGVLERSSVDPVRGMVDMIRTMRALESNLQMIRFQDATLERAVGELGRIPG